MNWKLTNVMCGIERLARWARRQAELESGNIGSRVERSARYAERGVSWYSGPTGPVVHPARVASALEKLPLKFFLRPNGPPIPQMEFDCERITGKMPTSWRVIERLARKRVFVWGRYQGRGDSGWVNC